MYVVREQNDRVAGRFYGSRSLGVDGDTAFASGIGVAGDLMDAVDFGHRLDVVNQDLVIRNAAVVEDRDVRAEHCEAVAHIHEHVVVRCERVLLGEVEVFVVTGLLVQNTDVLDAVRKRRIDGACPHLIRSDNAVRLNIVVDLVLQARNLQEAAVLTRVDACAHLECIKDLLTRDFCEHRCVAERMNVDDLLEGDVAGRDVRTDAAAVDKRDIRIEHEAICVCAQVAEVGFLAADCTIVGIRIEDREIMIGVRNNGVQQSVELVFDALDERIGFRIVLDLLGCREDLHREAAFCIDRQLADVCELRAGLAVEDVFVFLILHGCVDDGMAVTVDERICAGDVRDHFGGHPRAGLFVNAHVTDDDDVIRAFRLCCVDRVLRCGVDACAGVILAEAVDVFACFVHEVGRGGLGDGFRRGETDKRDLLAVCFKDLVSVEHRLVAFDLHKVRGNVRIFRLLDESKHLIHTVVEFMVAERCEIITDKVHDVDDRFALREGTDRSALYVVARVNKDDFVAFRFEGLLEICKTCVAPTVTDAAVHVVREQNDRVARRLDYRRFRRFAGCPSDLYLVEIKRTIV